LSPDLAAESLALLGKPSGPLAARLVEAVMDGGLTRLLFHYFQEFFERRLGDHAIELRTVVVD
jgi:hypothetical protein